MTGFGVADAPLGAGRITLEVRSVNHRFIDIRVRLPREMGEHNAFVEQLARAALGRGRVEVCVWMAAESGSGVELDKVRARSVLRAFEELASEMGIPGPVPLSLLANVPDLFTTPAQGHPERVREALRLALEGALVHLEEMKRAEGEHLHADLAARAANVSALVARIASHTQDIAVRQRQRLRERVARLTEGTELRADPVRIEQEIAILAANADVSEEIERLRSHGMQFERLLAASDAVGRRLDFLLQEMSREVNTVGAKASGSDVSFAIVELKAEIDRMREQVQNIE